jgi:hypothetical protein
MNYNNQSATPIQTEITSTAFRLPTKLLQVIDRWCGANDTTRSQFFRRSITDRVKSLGISCGAESNPDQLKSPGDNSATEPPKEDQLKWSPELYARLQRRRW